MVPFSDEETVEKFEQLAKITESGLIPRAM